MSKRIICMVIAVFVVMSLFIGCAGKSGNGDSKSGAGNEDAKQKNLEASLKVDITKLKSSDGQPLLLEMENVVFNVIVLKETVTNTKSYCRCLCREL